MRSLTCAVSLIAFAVLGVAQTPVSEGPLDKMNSCPKWPDVHSYETPPMRLVPEGEYEMGDHSGAGLYDEIPVHAVYIDVFYMDTLEVTNEKYCTYLNSAHSQGLIEVSGGVVYKKVDTEPYCDTTTSSPYSRIVWNGSAFLVATGKDDHPMVMVSWYGAAAYANWRSAQEGLTPCYDLETWDCNFGMGGYRLPTEAEWEKAARGGLQNPYYDYPWGNGINGSEANFWNSGDPFEGGGYPDSTPAGYYDGHQTPTGVDMANGYGLYDMAGNDWEWCNDWYDYTYYQYCVIYGIYYNPKGPSSSPYKSRVLRGGSWYDYGYMLRCASRYINRVTNSDDRFSDIGFRLALD